MSARRRWRRPLRRMLAAIAPPLLRAIGVVLLWTLRVEYRGDGALRARWAHGERVIVACWHGQLWMLPIIAAGVPMCIMVSHHRDGEMATRVLRAWRISTVRGSATRGGVGGFLRLVRAYRAGDNLAVLPDGPRGPAGVAKPGAVHLARAVAAPIYPIGAAASRSATLRSWDRLRIPLPFARIAIAVHEPLSVPADAGPEQLEASRVALERALTLASSAADSAVAVRPPRTAHPTA